VAAKFNKVRMTLISWSQFSALQVKSPQPMALSWQKKKTDEKQMFIDQTDPAISSQEIGHLYPAIKRGPAMDSKQSSRVTATPQPIIQTGVIFL